MEPASEALEKLGVSPKGLERAVVELVHRDSTPYYPHWHITAAGYGVWIAQDGTVNVVKLTHSG